MRFEERKPEDLSINAGAELVLDFGSETVVNDVFEVNGVKFVSPRMEDLETLVIHVLISESLNILLDEFIISLVGLDWVAQVILVDCLLVVTEEATDGLDARS